MEILLFVIIVFIIMGMVVLSSSQKSEERTTALRKLIPDYNLCHTFVYMPDGVSEKARYIIDKHKLLLYIDNFSTKKLITTEIKKITKCELILNDNLVQTTDSGSLVGRAIVGGVLMGGVGAVVGGITGSKTTKKADKVTKGKITIYYDDIDNPMQSLLFQKNNANIEPDISLFHAKLCACMSKAKTNEATTEASDIRQCPFCAEDIKKAAVLCKHCGKDVDPVTT